MMALISQKRKPGRREARTSAQITQLASHGAERQPWLLAAVFSQPSPLHFFFQVKTTGEVTVVTHSSRYF